MNNEDWKKDLEKVTVLKRCPKCGGLSLVNIEGKLKCTDCGFEQTIPKIK